MKGTCTGTAVYSNALSACVRARRSRIRVRARYSSTRKRTVTMMASATIVPQPLVLPQPPKTANAHPFQPFADGRFRRNFSVASNCLLPCCLPRGADLRAFKDEYKASWKATNDRKATPTAWVEPKESNWMAKYRGSLRAQSYTKMRWSRVRLIGADSPPLPAGVALKAKLAS